jgi:signal transduction histidine kinase
LLDAARFRALLGDALASEAVALLVVRGRSEEGARGPDVIQAFADAATSALRGTDLIAHVPERAAFVAALVSPPRTRTEPIVAAVDHRTTLARLASAMESVAGTPFDTGWVVLRRHEGETELDLGAAVEEALEHGARERVHHEFFASLAHELRTPLSSIRGYLETVLDQDLDRETERRFLETAKGESARMSRLLDGLLDSALLETRVRFGPGESSSIQAALAAAFDALAPMAAARRTVISLLSSEDYEVAVGCDQMTQVLINILENAVKHGREAGRIFVSLEAKAHELEVRVDDDGAGVPPDERAAIFVATRRGSGAQADGRGLGLAVVRLLLERAGGGAAVGESPLGGARFYLRVPLSSAVTSAIHAK